MHSHVLPIWRTIAAAYREWWRMLPVLRPLVVNAVLIVIAISALDALVPARWSMQDPSASIITLIEAALRALLLAPVVAAIHRFIIRDNITKAYALPLGDASFQRFFAWLFALELIGSFPLDFLGWMQAFNVSVGVSTVAFAAALVAAFVLMLRLAICRRRSPWARRALASRRRWPIPGATVCVSSQSSCSPWCHGLRSAASSA